MARTPLSILVIVAFLVNTFGPLPAQAQGGVFLPAPGIRISLSPEFNPPVLKGIKVHPDNPFRFDFILDKGDSTLADDQLKEESSKLIKYFLASLTVPEKDLWVNLSPYEKDRIVPTSFGQTEMGRDLLAQDYLLKQITASLIYPEDEFGKIFWKRIYQEASKRYGTTNIPVNTFNKVWIVPEKAVVYENAQAGTAYVVESKLRVMLEQDYLALEKGLSSPNASIGDLGHGNDKDVNALGSQIVREIVIPQLTKEVNENKNFAQLRQAYNSLILATWYKKKIKDSILNKVYIDRNKIVGVNISDPQEKQKIYQQYLKAFKKGVYNYIKEEQDPVTQQMVPRKYFSGGVSAYEVGRVLTETIDRAQVAAVLPADDHITLVSAVLNDATPVPVKQFSLRAPALGNRKAITSGGYTLIKDAPVGEPKGRLSLRIDDDAVRAFRSVFENITGPTGTRLKALLPFLTFATTARNKDTRQYLVGEQNARDFRNILSQIVKPAYVDKQGKRHAARVSVPTDGGSRQAIFEQIVAGIRILPDESIRQILTYAETNLQYYLNWWGYRITDWENVEISLVMNAQQVFELVRAGDGKAVWLVDITEFLNRYNNYTLNFARESMEIDWVWDESYSQTIGETATPFIKQNPAAVKEVMRVLHFMENPVDHLYGIGEYARDPFSRENRGIQQSHLESFYNRFNSEGQNSLYVRLFRQLVHIFRVSKIMNADGQEENRRLADTRGRIEAILKFIISHPELVKAAQIQGNFDQDTISQIEQLYGAVVRNSGHITINPVSKKTPRVQPGSATSRERPSSSNAGTGGSGPRTVYERRLLEEVERGETDYVPSSVLAYSGDKETKGPTGKTESGNVFSSPVNQKTAEERIVFVPFTRDENEYLNKINPASEQMHRTSDQGRRVRIFFGAIWPQFLIARADGAVTQNITQRISEALGLLEDPLLRGSIERLISLSTNVAGNRKQIDAVAQEIRNNSFLTTHNVYLHTETISRTLNRPGGGTVNLLSAIAFDIDDIEHFDVDGTATSIRYLGDRIDRLNEEVQALGFTYMGDTHGVVLKTMIRSSTRHSILPHLNNEPFVTPDGQAPHPLFLNIREALQRDYPASPNGTQIERIFTSRYRSTAIHEQQHTEDELRGVQSRYTGVGRRVAQEIIAYLRSMADEAMMGEPNAPYTDLVNIIELFLSYQFNPFARFSDWFGIYERASAQDLLLMAEQLGLSMTLEDLHAKPLENTNAILVKALELDRQGLKEAAKLALAQAMADQRAGRPFLSQTRTPESTQATVQTDNGTQRNEGESRPATYAGKQTPAESSLERIEKREAWVNRIAYTVVVAVTVGMIGFMSWFTSDKQTTQRKDGGQETRFFGPIDKEKNYIDLGWAIHITRLGDTLGQLAYIYYGNGDANHYLRIFNANGLLFSPDKVHEGAPLVIPGARIEYVIIHPGNTLEGIAKQFYGPKNFLQGEERIRLLNGIKDDTKLKSGRTLLIPLSKDRAMAASTSRSDAAMLNKGGIDFNADKVDSAFAVQSKGGAIKFTIDPAMLEQLQNAPGFVPVIISVQPMENLAVFLGLDK